VTAVGENEIYMYSDHSPSVTCRYGLWSAVNLISLVTVLAVNLLQTWLNIRNSDMLPSDFDRTVFHRVSVLFCLRAGRARSGTSSPGRVKDFLFSTSSRPVPGPT
jgi:hypothetical protein